MMKLELLSDDILDDMWNNPPTSMLNEFIDAIVILGQIAEAQAKITKQQILIKIFDSGVKPIYNTFGIPKQIDYYRIDIPASIWRELNE